VLYADPPWQYEIHQLAMNRSIERHYQTKEISAFVPQLVIQTAQLSGIIQQ
jgi:hypothetical protein